MKIPKKVRLGGHEYTVTVVKVRDEKKGSHLWGKTDLNHNTILLDTELAQSRMEETFWHEILHVCFNQAGIELEKAGEDKEEYLVNALAPQLYAVLKENKLV